MLNHHRRAFLMGAALLYAGLAAQNLALANDLKDADLEHLGVKPVTARLDAETGFVVGGRNATALIQGLPSINGRTIAALEADMRPDPKGYFGVSSQAGFLGPNEKLLEVLAADNRYVVDKLGLTHQDLARPLHVMGAAGNYETKPQQFLYHGRRYEVAITSWKGSQLSPFYDETETGCDAVVKNLENGRQLKYSLLVPYMIERYGFYEGKGTPYRVEPEQVIAVFDFLHPTASGGAGETTVFRAVALTIGGLAILALLVGATFRRKKASGTSTN